MEEKTEQIQAERNKRLEKAKISTQEKLKPWLLKIVSNRMRWSALDSQGRYLINANVPECANRELMEKYYKDVERFIIDFYKEQKNQKKSIKRIFKSLDCDFSVKNIQIAARVFLEEYRSALASFYPTHILGVLSDHRLTKMVNIATGIYIEWWLEKDENSRRNIREFSEIRYGEKCSPKDGEDNKRETAVALYNAYAKYCDLFELRQEQASKEKTRRQKKPDIKKNKRELDLVTLSWCDAWKDGYLQIIDILLLRRHFLNRKSKRDSKQNEVMCCALCNYMKLIERIEKCFWEGEKEFPKYIEYVAKCVLVQKIERTYHFMFCANIGKFIQKEGIECCDFHNGVLAAYFGRFSEIEGYLFDARGRFDSKGAVRYLQNSDPLDPVPGEETLLKIIYTDERNQYSEVAEEIMRRRIMADLLVVLLAVFPVNKQHAWTESDYIEAARFYHEEFDFIFALQSIELPSLEPKDCDENEKAHQYYDAFHELYMQLYKMDGSPLKEAVEKLKPKKQSEDDY